MFKVHRLADVAVRAKVIALDHVFLFARGSEDDDRETFGALISPQLLQDFEAIYLREFQIQQHELGHHDGAFRSAKKIVERLNPIVRHYHIIDDVVLLQGSQRERFVPRVVFHE